MHVQIEVWLCAVSDFSPTRDFIPAEPNGKMVLIHSQRKPKTKGAADEIHLDRLGSFFIPFRLSTPHLPNRSRPSSKQVMAFRS